MTIVFCRSKLRQGGEGREKGREGEGEGVRGEREGGRELGSERRGRDGGREGEGERERGGVMESGRERRSE